MAGSPFEVFRRNQRQLMVVLTGLAMFAFVFLDSVSMRSGNLPRSLSVILVAMLCAGGMWIIGNPRGRGSELALYGALIGGVLAFFGLKGAGQLAVVQTSIGSFNRDQMQAQAQRRSAANRFVQSASGGMAGGFGGTDDPALLQRAVLLHEANQRGVAINNDAVSRFISEISGNKLSQGDYKKLLRDMGLPEAELYSVLKEELALQQAMLMDLPPASQTGRFPLQTPLNYWQQFRMLQVRQALDVAAVPVAEFVSLVPEPNDAELQAFFERYKNQRPAFNGEPGFLVDRKVNLAYVSADFEAFESQAQEPTDAEVVAYYEANKQNYRVFDIPDDDTAMPDFTEDAAPASALEPVNRAETPPSPTPANPGEAAAQPDKEATPPAPALPEGGAEAASRASGIPVRLASFTQASAESPATAQPESSDESPVAPAEAPADPPANPELPPAAAPPTKPALPPLDFPELPSLGLPPGVGGTDGMSEPRYQPLDDNLKLQIRETMLRERAFEAMGVAVNKAFDEMTRYADEYMGVFEADKREAKQQELTERLKKYAADHKLRYAETGLKTGQELQSSVSEPIGQAMEPSAGLQMRAASVAQQAFGNDTLFYPYRADSLLRDQRYSYWKTADVPPRVPTLDEVKPQVVEAWKYFQARPLAEKRAAELAEAVKSAKTPMVEALMKQTITGKEEATPVSVRETPRFSWMSLPRNLPFQFNPMFMPPPQLSLVDGVAQPGEDFMKAVFDQLGPGETGVALNAPRSIYYVVQVKQRDATPTDGADNLGLRAFQQQFLMEGREGFEQGPYAFLAQPELNGLINGWRKSFEERYAVEWLEPDPNTATPVAQ